MCPACMASAAVITGSLVSTGGITAFAVKILRGKRSEEEVADNDASGDHCSEITTENNPRTAIERRRQDGYDNNQR
jgi:hypothetical protein